MLVVERAELAPALEAVRGGISRTGPHATRHVLLDAQGMQLRIMSTNGSLQLQTSLPVKSDVFALAAPAELLEIVQRLHGPITLDHKDNNLTVRANGTRLRLQCVDSAQFPEFPNSDTWQSAKVAASDFARCLAFVEPATGSINDVRPFVHGVLLAFQEKSVTCVGTDTFKMGIASMAVSGLSGSVIVPAKVVVEIVRAIRMQKLENVVLSHTSGRIRADIGTVQITSSVIDATYPDWRRVLATVAPSATIVEVNREELISAVSRVSLVAGKEPRVAIRFEPSKLTLEVVNGNQGAEEKLTAKCASSGEVSLNRHQVLVAAQAITSEQLRLRITGEKTVVLLAGDTRTAAYLLSPMNS